MTEDRLPLRGGKDTAVTLAIGLAAGMASGLLGVGGGIVIVPLLTFALAFTQHRAHATSLGAIVLIATVGAIRFAVDGEVDYAVGGLLALGGLVGAPWGARFMARSGEGLLKTMFGAFLIAVSLGLLLQ